MLRRVLAFSLIFILLWTSIGYAETQGRTWKLSDEEIQEAIKVGKEMKNNSSLALEWFISNSLESLDSTSLWLFTPFFAIAHDTSIRWKKYQELAKEEIENILKFAESSLMICVNSYGNKVNFAKDYHCVIKIGDKYIQPTVKSDQEYTTVDELYSSIYRAQCYYFFPTADIPRDAVIQVIAIGDKEEVFTVDLSKIR